jgi:hypothetical protein
VRGRIAQAWRSSATQWVLLVAGALGVVGWVTWWSSSRSLALRWGTVGEVAGAVATTLAASVAVYAAIRERRDRKQAERERDAARVEAEEERKREQARNIHAWWQDDDEDPASFRMVVRNNSKAEARSVSGALHGETSGLPEFTPQAASFNVPVLPPESSRSFALPGRPLSGTQEPWVVLDFYDATGRYWRETMGRLRQLDHPDGLFADEDLSDAGAPG